MGSQNLTACIRLAVPYRSDRWTRAIVAARGLALRRECSRRFAGKPIGKIQPKHLHGTGFRNARGRARMPGTLRDHWAVPRPHRSRYPGAPAQAALPAAGVRCRKRAS
jgi:hypothetical protein